MWKWQIYWINDFQFSKSLKHSIWFFSIKFCIFFYLYSVNISILQIFVFPHKNMTRIMENIKIFYYSNHTPEKSFYYSLSSKRSTTADTFWETLPNFWLLIFECEEDIPIWRVVGADGNWRLLFSMIHGATLKMG